MLGADDRGSGGLERGCPPGSRGERDPGAVPTPGAAHTACSLTSTSTSDMSEVEAPGAWLHVLDVTVTVTSTFASTDLYGPNAAPGCRKEGGLNLGSRVTCGNLAA